MLIVGSLASGCAVRDMMFSMLEGGYTEGGTTSAERRWHYERSVERHESPVGHYDPVSDR